MREKGRGRESRGRAGRGRVEQGGRGGLALHKFNKQGYMYLQPCLTVVISLSYRRDNSTLYISEG